MAKLLQFTDTHLYQEADGALKGVNTEQSFRACVQHALEHHPADAAILTGDLTHDATPEAYQRLNDICADLHMPIGMIPGNHDLASVMYDAIHPDYKTRTLVLDNWVIVLLNSAVPGHEHGYLEAAELAFCQSTLRENAQHPVLICLHHQPVEVGSAWLDTMRLQNHDEFFSLLKQHNNVRGVVWGHVHQEFKDDHAGIALIATPSTCIQFARESEDFALDTTMPGYRWFTLADNGNIETGVEYVEMQLELDEAGKY